jgi:BASS family bile acid:Na+ symporter
MSTPLKLVFLLFVTSFMLQCGLQAPRQSLACAVKSVREIVSALLVMLVFGPVVAVVIGRIFGLEGPSAGALLALSVVGIVPLAPKAAKKAHGDVTLAIVLLIALSVIAAFTATPSIHLLLSFWGFHAFIGVAPASLLLQLVVLQLLPLAAGVWLRERSARMAWLEKAVAVVNGAAFILIAALVVGPRVEDIRAIGLRGVAAGVSFAAILAVVGWAMGGPTPTGRRTLAAVANMPNVALALALAASAQAAPAYSVAVIAMFLVRVVAGFLFGAVLARSARPAGPEAGQAAA